MLFLGEERILTAEQPAQTIQEKNRKMQDAKLPVDVRATIIRVLRLHGVVRVSVFGSYARGEAGPGSDIDILVRFKDAKSLFELVHIQDELEQALHRKVDLVTEGAVSPYLIDTIRREEVVILE